MALADEQGLRQRGLQRPGLIDARHRQHTLGARCKGMGDQRAGAEDIDDDGDAGRGRRAGEQRRTSDVQPAQARTAPVSRCTKAERR
jgi:hypothetical protein